MKKTITTLSIIIILTFLAGNIFGQSWSSAGGSAGFSGTVKALMTDNTNNVMYAGGLFATVDGNTVNNVAKWNGSAWSAVGAGFNNTVWSLVMYNNELYAGGSFTMSGSTPVNGIAKWNGSAWVAVGTGVAASGTVASMCVFNNELYVGGFYASAGGVTSTKNMAKWNGTTWAAVGGGMQDGVMAMTVYNNELYAGGYFVVNNISFALQYRIAKLSGGSWVNVGSKGVGDANAYWGVRTLTVHNSALYASGYFSMFDNLATANHVGKWSAGTWSAMGSGSNIGITTTSSTYVVNTSASYNGLLYVGGTFTGAGGATANNIAMWDGTSWTTAGTGLNLAANAMAVYQNALYVGGDFTTAGGNAANHIAKWTTPTGIHTIIAEKASVSNYPNPFNSQTVITVNSDKQLQNAELTVYDMLGNASIQLQGINSNTITLERNNMAAGIYFYSIKDNNVSVATGKLVVE